MAAPIPLYIQCYPIEVHPSRPIIRAATSAPGSCLAAMKTKHATEGHLSFGETRFSLRDNHRFPSADGSVLACLGYARKPSSASDDGPSSPRMRTRSCVRSSRKDSRMWYVCYRHSVDSLAWQFRSPAASRESLRVGARSLRSGGWAVCSNARARRELKHSSNGRKRNQLGFG